MQFEGRQDWHIQRRNISLEEELARGKFAIKKWGKNKIVAELNRRDISKNNIHTALKEIDNEDYFATLMLLAKRKYHLLK